VTVPTSADALVQLIAARSTRTVLVVTLSGVLVVGLGVRYRRKAVPLALLAGLAAVFVGQQAAFESVVRPAYVVEATGTVDPAIDRIQLAFEVGFVAELLLLVIRLFVDGLFSGDDESLRSLRDAGIKVLMTGLVLAAGLGLATTGTGMATLVPALSLLFSERLVKTVVNLSVALAAE
jgi:hypothetical protein